MYEKPVFKLFCLVVHMSPLWWGLHLLTFRWPWYPWILCKGPTWPQNLYLFFLNSKGFYDIASIFDMQINLKERVDVNQDGPSLIIEAPPPGPQIVKDVNVFHIIMKNLLSMVFLCCTYVSSVMRSSWHFSTSGFNIRFPRTPQKLKRS